MPQLRRHARPLLRTVNGRKRASDDNCTEDGSSYSTRLISDPARIDACIVIEEDIYADPISSEDENFQRQPQLAKSPRLASTNTPAFEHLQFDGASEQSMPDTKPQFILPLSNLRPQNTGVEHEGDSSDHPSSESDIAIFSSQGSFKRPCTTHVNIHAQLQPQQRTSKKSSGYGKKADRQRIREEERTKKSTLQRPEKERQKKLKTVKPEFQIPTASVKKNDIINLTGIDQQDVTGPLRRVEQELSSPPLSDVPPSPNAEEIAKLDMPVVGSYVPQVECSICGAQVSKLLKENFEDNFNHSRKVNYRWQQRFCRFHRQESARKMWEERRYPHIDWETFVDRMKRPKHTQHVRRVMSGEVNSIFRIELEKNVRGRNKTLLQVMKNDDGTRKKFGNVGYYGPRGEKIMYAPDSFRQYCY